MYQKNPDRAAEDDQVFVYDCRRLAKTRSLFMDVRD